MTRFPLATSCLAVWIGISIGCRTPCDNDAPCESGRRRWHPGGECLTSDPCASDVTCAAQNRVCLGNEGRAECGRCVDDRIDDGTVCSAPVPNHIGPYRVTRDHFSVWNGERYRPVFLRGVNVGGARPGENADESSLTEADWMRWMGIWADAGMNVLRVYRVHPAEMYDALVRWNTEQPDRPIYLLQGVYYRELDAGEGADLVPRADQFDQDIARAIDCVHAQCDGYPDASPWVMGWIIGREIGADEVTATNTMHPAHGYSGEALSIDGASASEAWVVERLDHAVMHERSRYATERPVGFTNWLEIDPITHPTEPVASHQDVAQIDLAPVDATRAPAGHFISYHAYPYFPNFVNEDPGYQSYADALGPDPYRGILTDLRTHHADQAVLISEFGVPTSFAPAHPSISGMTQGGIDEAQQGVYAARMLRDIEEVGAAGGIWFQWEDGWWKRTWTSDNRAFPRDDFPLWHDTLSAEQGYGLLAFDAPQTDWLPLSTSSSSSARIRSVSASSGADRIRFRISLARPLVTGETLEIGLDVLDRGRGETRLPSGTALVASAAELAIVIDDAATRATMSVTPCLDLTELPRDLLLDTSPATRAGGCGGWTSMRWLFSSFHYRPSGCYVADEFYPLGVLPVRTTSDPATSRDAIIVDTSADDASITIVFPWNLIFVVDPSTGAVFDDRAGTPRVESTVTDGIVLAVSLGDELVETQPYVWSTWRVVPATTERLKAGTETFFASTRALPRWLD